MNLGEVFAEPLVRLDAEDRALEGIQTPKSALGAIKVGVTGQFLEHADQYHRNYLNLDYWRFLLERAFQAIGEMPDPSLIIDIGSGSGNSVIPLADRFPDAYIIATDISPQLLAILRDFLNKRADARNGEGGEGRFALVCVDAADVNYLPGVADLAVGAAILHHILDPAKVLASCHRALKPGGWAIFFEPFEAGNTIVRMTYERILARASAAEKQTDALRLLQRMVADYTVRQRAKSDPVFLGLDDKWMFTRTYFERIRDQQGWAELVTYALNVCPTMLRNQAAVHLKLGAQLPPSALPDWAWAVIDQTDAAISDDLRGEWAQEAAVMFRKAHP
ncbi:MAG TPA: class I SAM-dependent methyltransferase [Casimicrobiaceae bacterium]|nr:class I SAM-dependent methyltransferase [Casimicrobiaceae bacterium]